MSHVCYWLTAAVLQGRATANFMSGIFYTLVI